MYSHTVSVCVAIEPDEEIKLVKDTIQELNQELVLSPMNKWYKLILNNKLAQIAADAVVNATIHAAVSGASLGMDELTSFNEPDN